MVLYLTIIAISMVVLVVFNWLVLGWTLLGAVMWTSITTGIELAIIIALAMISGWCFPNKWYRECKLYAVGKREMNFYRAIRLGAWKDHVAEMGQQLSGFSKRKLANPNDPAYVDRFIYEVNRGILVHLVCAIGAFLILLLPLPGFWTITFPAALVGAFLNVLSIMVLRYNKPRLLLLKKRLLRNQPQPTPTAETPATPETKQ